MEVQAKSFYTTFACGLLTVMTVTTIIAAVGCSHNQELLDQTKQSSQRPPTAQEIAATQNYSPEMKRKIVEAEQLKKLQVEVYELQDRVYGNSEYGSQGLYGALRECRVANGAQTFNEPIDRIADKEPRTANLDDPAELNKMTEASLLDRDKRFQAYASVLTKRQDDLEDKLEICRGELKAHKDRAATPSPSYIQHQQEPDTQEAL